MVGGEKISSQTIKSVENIFVEGSKPDPLSPPSGACLSGRGPLGELFAGRLGDSEEPQEGQSAEEVPRGVREPQVVGCGVPHTRVAPQTTVVYQRSCRSRLGRRGRGRGGGRVGPVGRRFCEFDDVARERFGRLEGDF